jgi:hypothetical protein
VPRSASRVVGLSVHRTTAIAREPKSANRGTRTSDAERET